MVAKRSNRGFTLVELLTVVAIIGVLSAMVFPAVSRMSAGADDVKCASNLRQIGLGILAYTRDNDGTLPGPLFVGVYSYSWNDDPVALSTRIWKYVDMDKNNPLKKKKDVFICPSYDRLIQGKYRRDYSAIPGYILNVLVGMTNDTEMHQPFGYSFNVVPGTRYRVQEKEPMKLPRLADLADASGPGAASRIWAIKDCDAMDPLMRPAGYWKDLPQKMVHEDHRNAVFFDFHVGKVDADNKTW